ncbi:MAG TPA: Uma2 family endonuclease [Longimicrobium sp.]
MATQAIPEALPDTISFEEFLTSFDGVHAEWVDGRVYVMSPNTDRHSQVARFLITLLQTYAEEKGLGEVFVPAFAMRLSPKPSGREPDLFFVSREHLDRNRGSHLDGPADLVIEVISASTRVVDRGEKFFEYEQAGVPEYWLIDPERKKVEAYRLGEDGTYEPVQTGDPPVLRSHSLPGMWIAVEWLWQQPMPRVTSVQREWGLI